MNKKVCITSMLVIVLLVFCIIYYNASYSSKNIIVNDSTTIDNSKNISMMIETSAGSGEYQMSNDTAWPGSGYEYNERLSSCENGGKLIWNKETNSVSLKTNISDKCYLYFDYKPHDVTLATNHTANTGNTPATLSCSNATSNYNKKYGRIEISSINNKYTSCNLTYQAPSSKRYLNTYITGLSGQTQGKGQVVNENGYRYEGKNPNNYIWFNNELWRIIGVFDSATHGQSGKNLVKIIRDNSLGGLVWNDEKENLTNVSNNNSNYEVTQLGGIIAAPEPSITITPNDWPASILMNLLNGAYLNAQDGTDSGYCYGDSTTVPSNCNYRNKGISSTYRNMIANVKWYLRGHSSNAATAESFYNYERTTGTVYSGRPTEWQGKIGLMYPSDYGYSVLASSCARTTNIVSYNNATCAGESWLYGNGYEWTLTPNSSDESSVFHLNYDGGLRIYFANEGYSTRPVLYLDSSVYVIDGDGTEGNPYIIGI